MWQPQDPADDSMAGDFEAEQPHRWPLGCMIWSAGAMGLLITLAVLSVPVVQQARARAAIQAVGGSIELADEPFAWLAWLGDSVGVPLLFPVGHIDLDGCVVNDDTWQAVLHVAGPQLQVVWVDGTGLTDQQLAELTERAPGLLWLTALESRLTNQGLASLARCPELNNLAIDSPQLSAGWVGDLPPLKSLTGIELSDIVWDEATVASISRCTSLDTLALTRATFPRQAPSADWSPPAPSLRALSITDSTLTEAGLELLGHSGALHTLHFSEVTFPASGCRHLARLKHLDELSLYACRISDECVAELASCTSLGSVALWNSPVNGACLESLSRLPELVALDLDGTTVQAEQLKYLADYPKLESLDLTNTSLTDEAIPHLERCRKLTVLLLSGSRITADGLKRLKASLPGCEVAHDIAESPGAALHNGPIVN
ncbi:MAG: hypothetical protein KDA79_22685 [Planctomycetaceae bacterium]|nr:hypothetical protein [Planctomycetaceae bacterium]